MNRSFARLALGTMLLTLLPAALPAQFAHSDLQGGKKVIHTVLILPPQATVMKSGVKGNEPMVEESRVLESNLTLQVTSAMSGVGCTVALNPFSEESLNQNPDLKYALADLQTRYDKVWGEVARKPKDVRTGRYTLGDDVANFSPGAAADALVFVRGQEAIFTGGKKFLGAMSGAYLPSEAVGMSIALVDAQSGAVLYVDAGPPGIVWRDLEKSFKKFGTTKEKK
jgi:hypothetical protein